MIKNPFISGRYPGFTTWLNLAQVYQAPPQDYNVTRVGSAWRVDMADTNKGAKGVFTLPDSRKLSGYLDPNDVIYLNVDDITNDVPLHSQVLRNTSVPLGAGDIDRLERISDTEGKLYLNKETPWGLEPTVLNVKIYGQSPYVVMVTFKTTESHNINRADVPEGRILIDDVPFDATLELPAGIYTIKSTLNLGQLEPLFRALDRPIFTSVSKLIGEQQYGTITRMSQVTKEIYSVGSFCIYLKHTDNPGFIYFDVPTRIRDYTRFFDKRTVLTGNLTIFREARLTLLPNDLFSEVLFADNVVNLNDLFKGASIETVPEQAFKTINTVLGNAAKVTADRMFSDTEISNFGNDVLMGNYIVTTMRGFLSDSVLGGIPRVIPPNHDCWIFEQIYRGVSMKGGLVDSNPFKYISTTDTQSNISVSNLFTDSSISEFADDSEFPFEKIGSFGGLFSGSGITVVPAGIYDRAVNAVNITASFADTNVTEVPDKLYFNTSVSVLNSEFKNCRRLTKIGHNLVNGKKSIIVDYMFSQETSLDGGAVELPTDIFGVTSVTAAVECFAGMSLTNFRLDAPVGDATRMLRGARIVGFETEGLRLSGNCPGLLNGANVDIIGDKAIMLLGEAREIDVRELLLGGAVIYCGKRLFGWDGTTEFRLSSSGEQSMLSSKVCTVLGKVSTIREWINIPFSTKPVICKEPTAVVGTTQQVVESTWMVSHKDEVAGTLNSTRYDDNPPALIVVDKFRNPDLYMGMVRAGNVRYKPYGVSFRAPTDDINGVNIETDPERWFNEWKTKYDRRVYPKLYLSVTENSYIFSPVSRNLTEHDGSLYDYVFRRNGNVLPGNINVFSRSDTTTFLRNMLDEELTHTLDYDDVSVALIPDDMGASKVGKYELTVNRNSERYNKPTGTVRIDGFYGSLQKIISMEDYSIDRTRAAAATTIPTIREAIADFTGYEFTEDFIASARVLDDRWVVSIDATILGDSITLKLID